MTERVAFITGASRGIGLACAQELAEAGFKLVVHARQLSSLDKMLASLPNGYDKDVVLPLAYDMSDADAIREAFQEIFKRFRRLDVLVNNAGQMTPASLGMISRQMLDNTMDVNLSSAILHVQGAAKLMTRAGQGSIINVSSIVGRFGFEGQVVYAASKAGLIGATYSAAKELAVHGVRVNAVAPGYIDTELNRHHSEKIHLENLARVRMGRMGNAQDVANLVRFLATDDSAYITGQVIGVDGGMSL